MYTSKTVGIGKQNWQWNICAEFFHQWFMFTFLVPANLFGSPINRKIVSVLPVISYLMPLIFESLSGYANTNMQPILETFIFLISSFYFIFFFNLIHFFLFWIFFPSFYFLSYTNVISRAISNYMLISYFITFFLHLICKRSLSS